MLTSRMFALRRPTSATSALVAPGMAAHQPPSDAHKAMATEQTAATMEKMRSVLRLSGDALAASLTRAVPIRRVLAGGAAAFGTSKGTAKDYELSAPTKQYDYFLSHSWRASRWHKCWLLLLFFRAKSVLVGSLAGTVLGFVLTVSRALPPMSTNATLAEIEGVEVSLWCTLFALIGALLGVVIQDAFESVGLLPCNWVFLDKLCIHQTDDAIKTQGIRALGLFLRHSRKMLVLWSPEYFSRLWCCFELASFLDTMREDREGRNDVVFLPIQVGTVLFWIVPCIFIATAAPALLALFELESAELYAQIFTCVVVISCNALLSPVYFSYLRARRELSRQIAKFSLHDAECFDESDRELITKLVTKWYSKSDSDDAILAFDTTVKSHLRKLVAQQGLVPWRLLSVAIAIATMPPSFDYIAARCLVPDTKHRVDQGADVALYAIYILGAGCCIFWPSTIHILIRASGLGAYLCPASARGDHGIVLTCCLYLINGLLVSLVPFICFVAMQWCFFYLSPGLNVAAALVVASSLIGLPTIVRALMKCASHRGMEVRLRYGLARAALPLPLPLPALVPVTVPGRKLAVEHAVESQAVSAA